MRRRCVASSVAPRVGHRVRPTMCVAGALRSASLSASAAPGGVRPTTCVAGALLPVSLPASAAACDQQRASPVHQGRAWGRVRAGAHVRGRTRGDASAGVCVCACVRVSVRVHVCVRAAHARRWLPDVLDGEGVPLGRAQEPPGQLDRVAPKKKRSCLADAPRGSPKVDRACRRSALARVRLSNV